MTRRQSRPGGLAGRGYIVVEIPITERISAQTEKLEL
jgi:hypothetical protein